MRVSMCWILLLLSSRDLSQMLATVTASSNCLSLSSWGTCSATGTIVNSHTSPWAAT